MTEDYMEPKRYDWYLDTYIKDSDVNNHHLVEWWVDTIIFQYSDHKENDSLGG